MGISRTLVLAPNSCQELANLTYEGIRSRDKYRSHPHSWRWDARPDDGACWTAPEIQIKKLPHKDWTLNRGQRKTQPISSIAHFGSFEEEEHNWKLMRKLRKDRQRESEMGNIFCRWPPRWWLLLSGLLPRIAKGAVQEIARWGDESGLIRPISLWPFLIKAIKELTKKIKHFFVNSKWTWARWLKMLS